MAISKSDVTRLYLQSVLSRRVMTDELAKLLWKKCVTLIRSLDDTLEINYDPAYFSTFIIELNETLNPLDLELRSMIDEVTSVRTWALVNTNPDVIAQMATDYSPLEIAYFKQIVERIILGSDECYSLSSIAALREVSNLKGNMSKTVAEGVLGSFVAKGWLLKSQRGRYSLSTRSILELQNYLKTNYEDDILECTLCLEICTKGISCYTASCVARLHSHCFKTYRQRNQVCPSCKADWTNTSKLGQVGEDAVRDGEDTNKRGRKAAAEEEDDDNAESEVQPESEEQESPKRRVSKRIKAESEPDGDGMAVDKDEEESQPPATQTRSRRRR